MAEEHIFQVGDRVYYEVVSGRMLATVTAIGPRLIQILLDAPAPPSRLLQRSRTVSPYSITLVHRDA